VLVGLVGWPRVWAAGSIAMNIQVLKVAHFDRSRALGILQIDGYGRYDQLMVTGRYDHVGGPGTPRRVLGDPGYSSAIAHRIMTLSSHRRSE
jgi:hypothetical protein